MYRLSDQQVGMGASLGNSAIWINTKSTGAIERVFSNALAQSLIGTLALRYGSQGLPFFGADSTANQSAGEAYVGLGEDRFRRDFEIHPAYQRTSFSLADGIQVRETVFVPLSRQSDWNDPSLAYIIVELKNDSPHTHQLRVIASARLRGSTNADIQARFDPSLNALVAWNAGMPAAVRIFGLSQSVTRYETNFDYGSTYDPSHVHALTNTTQATGDVLGQLQLDLVLDPGERQSFTFRAGVYLQGEEEAVREYVQSARSEDALAETVQQLENALHVSEVITPDATINQGALWSKANMRRVMARYPQGLAFTNDPGNYANIVVRDTAWFVYGNDHFLPSFSRAILDNIRARQYPSGKLPEYYEAIGGRIEDDGLNINDDTPLYILAVNHHWRATGDPKWLQQTYSSMAAAARYIISQIDDRGLVYCTANDPRGNVWAIASWRNIIPLYSINGAVTEINAECVAALRAAGHLAENLGGHETDANDFAAASARIRAAMDEHLINPENGLYYMNIDVEGNAHTDVTGDEIFPVMFRACDADTAYRVVSRLNAPDFATSAGIRTASRNDLMYEPSNYSGLMGGVWPGLTWWYAFATARYHPEFMVHALRSSFEHYAADPKKNNTVPGQFSEWFDGESLANKGMRLSPWEPPRFLWAAIEGVCGLMLAPGEPRINPLVPDKWSWVALRNLPYHGSSLSYFALRHRADALRIYTTVAVESEGDVDLFERDVTDDVDALAEGAAVVALASEDRIAILVGNVSGSSIAAPVNCQRLVDASRRYYVRTYNSELLAWENDRFLTGSELRGVVLFVDGNGYRLLEILHSPP